MTSYDGDVYFGLPAIVFNTADTDSTIGNNPSQAIFNFSPSSRTVNESDGSARFTLTRSSSSGSQTVYVSITTTEGSTNSGDYSGILNRPVNFSAGETGKTITIHINDDSAVEPDETFGLIVQENSSNPANTFLDKATFTIVDDDDSVNPPPPTANFSWSPASPFMGQVVSFSDTSTGSPEAYAWDFDGDGVTDNLLANPSYAFRAAGSYVVKLEVCNKGAAMWQRKQSQSDRQTPPSRDHRQAPH